MTAEEVAEAFMMGQEYPDDLEAPDYLDDQEDPDDLEEPTLKEDPDDLEEPMMEGSDDEFSIVLEEDEREDISTKRRETMKTLTPQRWTTPLPFNNIPQCWTHQPPSNNPQPHPPLYLPHGHTV